MAGDDEMAFVQDAIGSDLDTMVVHNLLRTHTRLESLLDADLRRMDMTGAQLNALLVLRSAPPEGMVMNEIGRQLVVTRSNVTGLVDRLERQGLVTRQAHSDRRATLVRLTAEGLEAIDRTVPGHVRMLAGLTQCLSEAEKQSLIRILTKLRRHWRQNTEAR